MNNRARCQDDNGLEHSMKYQCGTNVMLGDEIMVEHSLGQKSLARVIVIGEDLVIDEIDKRFYSWAKSEGIIKSSTVVVEWIGANPLEHNDPNYSPVSKYLILDSLCCEKLLRQGDNVSKG